MELTTLQINIDSELKKDFKVCVTKNKENMTEILINAIKEYVKQNKED